MHPTRSPAQETKGSARWASSTARSWSSPAAAAASARRSPCRSRARVRRPCSRRPRSKISTRPPPRIGNRGPKPLTFAGDLKTLEACEALHAFVKDKAGRCDVLVNNAGATRSGNFLEMPDEAFHDGFALKYFACMRLCKLFWPMLKGREGHVVNIIGGAARTPDALFLSADRSMPRWRISPRGFPSSARRTASTSTSIHPGLTETDRVITLMQQRAQANGITPDEARKQVMAKDGLRRIGQPEDVAELALFLCQRARAAHPGRRHRGRRRADHGVVLDRWSPASPSSARA